MTVIEVESPSRNLPKADKSRHALLASIEKGKKLKKTKTYDRSMPMVDGKIDKLLVKRDIYSVAYFRKAT
jgi:WH2 motif